MLKFTFSTRSEAKIQKQTLVNRIATDKGEQHKLISRYYATHNHVEKKAQFWLLARKGPRASDVSLEMIQTSLNTCLGREHRKCKLDYLT